MLTGTVSGVNRDVVAVTALCVARLVVDVWWWLAAFDQWAMTRRAGPGLFSWHVIIVAMPLGSLHGSTACDLHHCTSWP